MLAEMSVTFINDNGTRDSVKLHDHINISYVDGRAICERFGRVSDFTFSEASPSTLKDITITPMKGKVVKIRTRCIRWVHRI